MSMADDYDGYDPYDPYDFEDRDTSDVCFRYLKGSLVWKTKDGKSINVRDMTESHIRSCLRIFSGYKYWTVVFNYEIKRRANEI